MDWKQRYNEAHRSYYQRNHPDIIKIGAYPKLRPSDYPNVLEDSGIENYIEKFMHWNNHFAERVKTMGVKRKINGVERWTKGTGKKGSADVHLLFTVPNKYPIPVKVEVKVGKDSQKDDQKEYERIMKSIGCPYHIVKVIDDFLFIYDYYTQKVIPYI